MIDISHLHPMTVHFPIALILTGLIFDIISFFRKDDLFYPKVGLYLIVLGSIGALLGYLTGEFFTEELKGRAGELKELHELFAKTSMFILLAVSACRICIIYKPLNIKNIRLIIFSVEFIGAALLGIAGYLGGSLVYNYLIK
jgi:uncharacterized membrane protein